MIVIIIKYFLLLCHIVDSFSYSIKWHARLEHICQDRMSRLAKESLLDQLTKVKLPRCESCIAGKGTAKHFSKASRASSPLELIHLTFMDLLVSKSVIGQVVSTLL